MLNVLFPWKRCHYSRRLARVASWLTAVLLVSGIVRAQPPAKPAAPPKPPTSSVKPPAPAGDGAAAKSGALPAAAAAAPADAAKAAPPADGTPPDPSHTRRITPNEVFRDPKAEALLDVSKFPELMKGRPAVGNDEIDSLRAMAGETNVTIDKALIDRFIDAQIAKLTDHANIEAVLAPPESGKPAAARVIHEATSLLLEPIYRARFAKNAAFLTSYNRALLAKLPPLLKNHLIPRIQAMIVLGESGNPEALRLFEDQIKDKDKSQTIWVKLWALEGISNIHDDGAQLTGTAQIEAAKVVSDFLDQNNDIPWPAQLRALEALGAMRQGYLPTQPQKASMATSAMRLLTDPQSKLEVKAEAARALGLMQITNAVDRYNYALVAQSIAQIAVELGQQIGSNFAGNRGKSEYLTGLLVGPVYQSFDGVPGARDAGLLHGNLGTSAPAVQKVFDVVKPVASTAVALIRAPGLQTKGLLKDLAARVAELKDYLEKNPVQDRHLVRGGIVFPLADLGQPALSVPAPLAGAGAGAKP